MKILVDELPNKPEDCLFYHKKVYVNDYSGDVHSWYCCLLDNCHCNIETCKKLKTIKE